MSRAAQRKTPAVALERPFADKRLAVRLTSRPADFPFTDFAQELARATGGTIVARLGGPGLDEAYWDIRIGQRVLTLHHQHFLGVYLLATSEDSEELLQEVLPFAEAYLSQPRTLWRRFRAAWRKLRHAAP